jgi:signal transduction histidine kinase/DNA-binding response OmpR family regulator
LWVGTGGGLNKYDYKTDSFQYYNQNDGLPSNKISGILEDEHGNLWLSTDRGLSKFNPVSEVFRNYDTHDGLYHLQFNFSSCLKTADGQLLFGGTNGITAFYPDSIRDNPHIPPIIITDFRLFNESVPIARNDLDQKTEGYHLPQHISTLDEITLSYRENIFSFEFSALDYHSPQKNQYAYFMEGVDPDWVHTDASRRFASYTNLDPGEYIFRVKGSNSDGIWNESGTSIKVLITPPWWLSSWAYAAYFLLIIAMVVTIWRFQLRRIHLRNELKMKSFEAQQLQEVDQMKSWFFANISHEFRTPLTLIQGPVKQIINGEFVGNLKDQCKMILRNSDRLLHLINQILDLSKLESGRMKIKANRIDIISYLKGLVQSFASMAEYNNVSFTLNSNVESQVGYVDRDKLEKIITNLLSNAFKFTPEGGEVSVDMSLRGDSRSKARETTKQSPSVVGKEIATSAERRTRNDQRIELSISNTGPGIPRDQLEKIFDRFYQADNSYKKDSEGTGIGLTLTKELVQACGGEIRVESEPDKLTTFTVLLPISKEHFKVEEIIEEQDSEKELVLEKDTGYQIPDTGDQEKSGIRHPVSGIQDRDASDEKRVASNKSPLLLIVEDNPDVTSYISSFLEKDYRIITAENGEEGWKKALKKFPDLIISDVMMPVMDGFELCKKLKSDQRTSHIPIILLTARADMESKLEGLEFGSDDYVTKPFDAKELQIRCRNLLEQRRRLREKFSKELAVEPHEITVSSLDEKFITRALQIIEEKISDPEFGVEKFSREIGMSRANLYRKLQAITGHTAKDYIRIIRLKRAALLLQKRTGNITEIAFAVGFNSPSYFSECFRKYFGQLPSTYSSNYSQNAQ